MIIGNNHLLDVREMMDILLKEGDFLGDLKAFLKGFANGSASWMIHSFYLSLLVDYSLTHQKL